MILPTAAQQAAAVEAARQAIANYSEWDSSMVPDSALASVVNAALTAALNVQPPKGTKP
jgi:hypothetical protein